MVSTETAAAPELDRIFSALISPMSTDGSLNTGIVQDLVDYQLAQGTEGFYCCGSSGEALLLSLEERRVLVRAVVDAVRGRVPVIAHVGAAATADAIHLAQCAQDDGVQAISMIPPYYYSFTSAEIIGHYQDVIANCELPMLVYNIPQFTSVSFDKANAFELFANPRVVGLKHTSQDLYALERIGQAFPGLILLNGFDEMFLPALAAGAHGTVGTTVNVQARQFKALRDAFLAGDIAQAQRIQSEINDVVEMFVEHGIFSSVKYYLELEGISVGVCRAPFGELTKEGRKAIRKLHQELAQ